MKNYTESNRMLYKKYKGLCRRRTELSDFESKMLVAITKELQKRSINLCNGHKL